jgi:hypothetical protein
VIGETAPAVEEQRTFSPFLLIGKVDVIQSPCRVHAADARIGFLLPVKPPKVDALIFQWMMQDEG